MNYQESAQLVKTDSKENPLPGAKFKLIDKEGKTVIQNLVSDDKGVVLVKIWHQEIINLLRQKRLEDMC